MKESFSVFFYSVVTKAFSSSVLNKIQGPVCGVNSVWIQILMSKQ